MIESYIDIPAETSCQTFEGASLSMSYYVEMRVKSMSSATHQTRKTIISIFLLFLILNPSFHRYHNFEFAAKQISKSNFANLTYSPPSES